MLKCKRTGKQKMQNSNILNLNIKQSKLYGFAKNCVLLLLLFLFSSCGKVFVQNGSLLKELLTKIAAEDIVYIFQFVANEMERSYMAVKAALMTLFVCMCVFFVCRVLILALSRNCEVGINYFEKSQTIPVCSALVFCASVYSFCLKYKE